MRDDTDNQPESDTTRRGSGGCAWLPARSRRVVSDSGADIAHGRHDEGAPAERRQELDRQQPLDASGNLAERVRATTFTADAKGVAAADAKGAADADAEAFGRRTAAKAEKDAAEADAAEAEARHGHAAERDGEKLTPTLASLALLRKKSERARGPAPRLRPAPNVGRKPPGRGLVGGGKIKERRAPAAPRNAARGGPAPRL